MEQWINGLMDCWINEAPEGGFGLQRSVNPSIHQSNKPLIQNNYTDPSSRREQGPEGSD